MQVEKVEAAGLQLAYREQGSGPPVLLLHGWPTSSFLWRNVMPPIAERNRVIALDLPGFGASDKPPDTDTTSSSSRARSTASSRRSGSRRSPLAVHDLGGPVGCTGRCDRPSG